MRDMHRNNVFVKKKRTLNIDHTVMVLKCCLKMVLNDLETVNQLNDSFRTADERFPLFEHNLSLADQ